MVKLVSGNIFDSRCSVIVNPVNTVGVMGAGLALAFKKRYPGMFQRYRACCQNGSLTVGKLMLVHEQGRGILLFPTKAHWRDSSRMEYLSAGLAKFCASYRSRGITSIAFPMLGTGCGGLDPDAVLSLMRQYLDPLDIEVEIYCQNRPR